MIPMDIYRAKIRQNGKNGQLIKAMEELSELAIAIAHYLEGRTDATMEIIEESEDVRIMLEQIDIMFRNPVERNRIRTHKLKRLAESLG